MGGYRLSIEKTLDVSRRQSTAEEVLTVGTRPKLWKASFRHHGRWAVHLWG